MHPAGSWQARDCAMAQSPATHSSASMGPRNDMEDFGCVRHLEAGVSLSSNLAVEQGGVRGPTYA